MGRKKSISCGMGAVAFLLIGALCSEAWSESMTLTTYYPSPTGNYKRIRLSPYANQASMPQGVPAGTLAYCCTADKDGNNQPVTTYSLFLSVPSGSSTIWVPVGSTSDADIINATLAQVPNSISLKTYSRIYGSGQWVLPWAISNKIGIILNKTDTRYVQAANPLTATALYHGQITGTICNTPPPIVVSNDDHDPFIGYILWRVADVVCTFPIAPVLFQLRWLPRHANFVWRCIFVQQPGFRLPFLQQIFQLIWRAWRCLLISCVSITALGRDPWGRGLD